MKKKYVLKEFDSYSYDNEELSELFEELSEQGYRYHSYLPGNAYSTDGGYSSTYLIFEKDVENEPDSDKDF